MLRRSFLFLPVLLVILVALAWLRQPVSNQELLANFAKAQDFLAGAKSVGGLPWWSPMFMQGTSLAISWSFMVSNAVMWVFSIPLGFLAGPKIAVLVLMLLGSAGVYLFLRKYTDEEWSAGLGGLLFLLCPSLLTRAAGYEHFVVVCSMALLPWSFFSLLLFFRSPGIRTAVFAGAAFSSVVLAYGKTGVMALPVLILFSLTEYFGRPAALRPSTKLILWGGLTFLFLAVVPVLPALRETGFVALFEFGPFAGWQRAFSTKSALAWIDRAGLVTRGIDGAFAPTTANGGTYVGLLVFVVMTTALFLGTFHETELGRKARLFFAFALATFWLSFGPKGVLGGHFLFLSLSLGAPDYTPALGWFFLAAQVWIIFRLVPPNWPGRVLIGSVFSLIYLFVPGFRILEWLPIYANIRAPFDFFHVTGAVCLVISSAIIMRILLARLRPGAMRSGLFAAVCCIAILDVASYARPFFQGTLEKEVFGDFLAAEEYIRSSPLPGRVYAFSGRYFYLLTPYLTGRPLVAEAFNNYLQQRGAALLQATAFTRDETLTAYLNVSGVSHVLIDKTDPDTSAELQGRLRNLWPVAFENDRFVVLENDKSLGTGFLAQDFIQASGNAPEVSTAVFGGARYNLATIELPGAASGEAGLRGRVVNGRIDAWKPGQAINEGRPFLKVTQTGPGNYQRIAFAPAGQAGWLVMNQAWHPDWKAFAGGKPLEIRRAMLAFQAVKTDGKQGVEFVFQQPWWYGVCAGIGILSWVTAIVFLTFPARTAGRQKVGWQ